MEEKSVISREDFYAHKFQYDPEDECVYVDAKDGSGQWHHNMDGSGGFTTKHGTSMFFYDKTTREVFLNGQYRPAEFEGDWMARYEDMYREHYAKQEQEKLEQEKLDILNVYAQFSPYQREKASNTQHKLVAISPTTAIPTKQFLSIKQQMSSAADRHFRDAAVTDLETARTIEMARQKADPKKNDISFQFENEPISFPADNLIPIQAVRDKINNTVPYSQRTENLSTPEPVPNTEASYSL